MSYPVNRKALAQTHVEEGLRRLEEKSLDQAILCFETAAALAPSEPDIFCNLARALGVAGRWGESERAARVALDLRADHAPAAHVLGVTLAQGERLGEAATWLRMAADALPDSALVQRDAGVVELFLGDHDNARRHFMRALTVDVHSHEVLFNLVRITDMAADTEEVRVLFGALNNLAGRSDSLTPAQRTQIYFSLAKAHEDRGQPDAAFHWMREGNRSQREKLDYDGEDHARRLRQVAKVFDTPLFDRLAGEGNPTDRPIFILGMPRSGTTLVEQIVSAHPDVYGGGETAVLMQMLKHAHGADGSAFPDWGATMQPADCRSLAEYYLEHLPPVRSGEHRITDKRLENVEYIGFIQLILPNAPIIHVRRDPRDTALSCYALLFSEFQEWSYDFDDIARFWRESEALMGHWKAVLPPGRILEVSYEALVGDLENQARRIVEHCGLDWDDSCLEFHKSRRAVRSASSMQVRQPIYDTSIGRWRRFAAHMAPLYEAMGVSDLPAPAPVAVEGPPARRSRVGKA